MRSALTRLADVPGTYRVGLALVEGGGRRLLFTASDRDSASSVPWCEIDAYADVPLTHTVRTGEAVLEATDDLAQRFRVFTDLQPPKTRALAAVPIISVGQVLGGYVLFFDTPQRFDPPQLSELEDLGERLGTELRQIQRATVRTNASLTEVPVPEGAQAATFSVIADPRAVGQARHFAFGTLTGWGVDEAMVNSAILCLSELVTNAVIHTNAGGELHLLLDHGVLTTTVRDGGSSVVVAPDNVRTDPLVVHGRGLQLVDAFSTRWGSQLDAGGMAVWFVLEPARPGLD